ncbi:Putative Bifunctional DNA primase/polymerase, N-terminal [endosymbiont DhMRE of Dentiscutata heterogama]|uniref:bifunctional DNA primase/polymerase n=1 Tax=endosymbiont DhMRE of Dentiscutata heterogama TaxID=1609546 RepID=UPI000629DBAE|nr:bifunctional DNA primase/polymerase [endosymbiont DhMRE of Dentiscutata heterogama]CFW93076.1 Putative Bifunctional DNA primase/polymerase, N-terminal [endosymbiont DhMRE of Dentiscutata heterogama]
MKAKLTITENKYLRILTKKHILLPTKNKKPLVKGWNKYYAEHRSIAQLLQLNQEYSLRTGTLIGNYYFIAVDLDDLWARERIKDARYIQTANGIHRYVLIKELPKSCWLVNQNGDLIGELHSKGRFVVGIGSIHEKGVRYTLKGRVNEKWSLKFEKLAELQEFLKARNIFTTPWGKKGKENIRDLEFYEDKPVQKIKSQFKPIQNYYQKKEQLEKRIQSNPRRENLNICYICLVCFTKESEIIKSHLAGKRHQKNWKTYQQRQKNKAA